jgi:hypothetical protein
MERDRSLLGATLFVMLGDNLVKIDVLKNIPQLRETTKQELGGFV